MDALAVAGSPTWSRSKPPGAWHALEGVLCCRASGLSRMSSPSTAVKRPHNLRLQPTQLIGRDHDLEVVCERLLQPDVRLLTLSGPGGTGKTRLALAVGERLLDLFVHGVFFVDLAPLHDPALVPTTLAATLDVTERPGRPLLAFHRAAPAPIRSNRSKAASSQGISSQVLRRSGTRPGSCACEPPSAIQFNSLARSLALCQRSSGSFARHFLTTRASAGGVIGCKAAMGCGSEERMAAIKLARVFPANAGLPVAIS